MSELRLLIVEDNERDLTSFRNSVKVYTNENQRSIKAVECKTLEDALETLDNSFDGAIIDLKLADQSDEGNQVVKKVIESFFRIPIAIFTRNRGNWDDNLSEKIMLIGVFAKGAIGYGELLDKFWDIYNTGLTHIMGSRGKIETTLNEVFLKNLKPNIQRWIGHAKDGEKESERTEKALLRYTLNHLFQLLEEDGGICFPDEVYLYPLYPPVLDKITTGNMVRADDQWFVVLSPACDLVPRGENGKFKTDCILLAEIEKVIDALDGKKNKGKATELCSNKHDYHHWLPETDFFEGGVLNFRKLLSLNKDDFDEKFGKPIIQISPFFLKDIVSRFSSYYARQGQPEIDSKAIQSFITRYTP